MALDRPASVLDLLITRRRITIEHQAYELKHRDEFSIFDYRRLERLGQQLEALEALDTPTPEQEAEYAATLDAVVRMVLLAPDTVYAQLAVGQRALVVRAFFGFPLPTALQTAAADVPLPTPSSRRASRVSTAARRRTG